MASPGISIVVPAYNEGPGIAGTVRALLDSLGDLDPEIVVSDDGSKDGTAAEVERLVDSDPRVRLLKGLHKGRGAALKAGLEAARGDLVVTVDADLSYGPADVRRIVEHLRKHPLCDLVLGSCYMPGGKVEGVPARRLWISRVGNRILRQAFFRHFHTTTGILRGYRRERIQALLPSLASDGKELYLESLHKALMAEWTVEEIPATLTWRRAPEGGSFPFLPTVWSHLSFVMARRWDHALLAFGALQLLTGCFLFAAFWEGSHHIPRRPPGEFWSVPVLAALLADILAAAGVLGAYLAARARWREILTPPPPSP